MAASADAATRTDSVAAAPPRSGLLLSFMMVSLSNELRE
jgi:hypothetical protein